MYHVVSGVMRTDLHTLPVSGITVRDIGALRCHYRLKDVSDLNIEDTLNSTAVQGYPIVSNDGLNTLMGYIGRAELRYVIGAYAYSRATALN